MVDKNLFLIFDKLKPVHLTKDVIELISDSDGSTFDRAYIFTCSNFLFKNSNKSLEIKNMNFPFFRKFFLRLYVFNLIGRNDYLLLYHGGILNYLFATFVKLFKPNVSVLLKLDFNDLIVFRLERNKNLIDGYKDLFRRFLGQFIDYYFIETASSFRILNEIKPFKTFLKLIPNGINASSAYEWDTKKENIFLAVGRIGADEKNHRLILEAFAANKYLQNYKLYFIGPVEKEFQNYFNRLCVLNPTLKENVLLVGNIENREELYQYYKRAKFICFSSFYEGFSIAMIEAVYFGCYLISTDLAVAKDLTCEGKYGKIVTINKSLLDIMEQAGVVDFVQYIHSHQNEILQSDWFRHSVNQYAAALEEVIYSTDVSQLARDNSMRVYNDYNWPAIRTKFNAIIR